MLPQLSLDVSLDRKLSTDTTGAVPNRNNKMLDLIIGTSAVTQIF